MHLRTGFFLAMFSVSETPEDGLHFFIDIEYNKRLDRQRPCLEGDLTAGSNL